MGFRDDLNLERKLYVHYGADTYDRDRFKQAENDQYRLKPNYGLWGSPVESMQGWKQWCEENEFREINEENCFYFRIRGWQVYEIETAEDLHRLPHIQLSDEEAAIFPYHDKLIDFDAVRGEEHSISALDIKIDQISKELPGYDCDCILVLDDRDLIVNYDAKKQKNPLTLKDLLPMKWFKTISGDIEVSGLLKCPNNEIYIYCEQPDEHYFFKSIVACISDGRIVETCGYTEWEAKSILQDIFKDADEIIQLVTVNRKG